MRSFLVGLAISIVTFSIVWYALLAMDRHAQDYQECGYVFCEAREQ